MYYHNQEHLKNRFEQFCKFNLLDPLDQIYKELRLNLDDKDRNTFLDADAIQPDCFQTQEIFAFTEQSEVFFQAYGGPTTVQFHMQGDRKQIFIGTKESVIICMSLVHGRVDKVEAIFNAGENQRRYGEVKCLCPKGRYLLAGMERGDVQLFEVSRKWERLQHQSHCHKSQVVQVLFQQEGEAISLDDQGVLLKHNFNVMNVMDRLITKASYSVIYENGRCKKQQASSQQQIVGKKSWWGNAKSLFQSDNKDNKSEMSTPQEQSISGRTSYQEEKQQLALDLKCMADSMADILQQEWQKYSIVAIQFHDRVEILKVFKNSLKCERVYLLKRNLLLSDNESPIQRESGELSWGEGYFQRSYQNAKLLSVRWGDVIHLVKCMNIEEDLEIVEGAVLRVQKCDILQSAFLTNNIICLLLDDDSISLVHTTQFQFAKTGDDFMFEEQKTRMLSKEDIEVQEPEIKIQYSDHQYPYKTVCQIQDNAIAQLRKGKLLIERLQTWEEYLQDMIAKNQYEKALQQGKLIYQGQIKILGQVASSVVTRQEEMKLMLEKIAFTHILFLLKPIDIFQKWHQDEIEKKIKKTFEFLIKTDNTNYILGDLRILFKDLDQLKLFFICFEPFVINKQIAVVPESFIEDYITYHDKSMISKLILQLDLRLQEPTPLIKVCMDLQLYKPMIYLCSKQGDFITALMKLVDLWERRLQAENIETNQIEKEKLRQIRIKLGYNIQGYIRMCFKGINILGERVPQAIFTDMLRSLLKYLFNVDNLLQFLSIDIRISLQLLNELFQNKLINIININDTKFQLQTTQISIVNQNAQLPLTLMRIINLIESVRENILLKPIPSSTKIITKEECQYHFILFYSKLIQYFNLEIKKHVFRSILDKQYFHTLNQYQVTNSDLNLNAYLIYLFSQANLQELSQEFQFLSEPFQEFTAYLYFCQRNYAKTFQLYIQAKDINIKQNIFEVIQLLLHKKTSQREMIQSNIIKIADQLVIIDEKQSYEIFRTHFSDNSLQMQIINELSVNQQSQLVYLQFYINQNYNASDEIRLMYLDLLCQLQPKAVFDELHQRPFPLDDALKVCEKYKIYNAVAYLLQKNGAIQKALDMLSQMFFFRLKESHKSFAKTKIITEIDNQEITEKLMYIIELIASSQKQDENYEQLWYQFLDNFFKDFKIPQLTDSKVPEAIRKLHCEIVAKVFLHMSQSVALDILLDRLEEHYGSLPVRVFWDTNDAFRSKFKFEASTYKLAMEATDRSFRIYLSKLVDQSKAGLVVGKYCDICEDLMSKCTQAVVFQCGHHFHQECFIEQLGNSSNESFNSLKMKNLKIIPNCLLCLNDTTQFIQHTILQIYLKRKGIDLNKYQHQSVHFETELNQKKQVQNKSQIRKKRIRAMQLLDFNNSWKKQLY